MKNQIFFYQKNFLIIVVRLILILLLIFLFFQSNQTFPLVKSNIKLSTIYEPIERFGITAPYLYSVENLESFNVKAVLDWQNDNSIPLPPHIEYIHVLRVSDDLYSSELASLPTLIPINIGEVWIIGNEPDRFCYQDSVNPEVYAERFFEMATIIQSIDPSAQLGFGTVVQPTPIRIRYLQRAIDRLVELNGNDVELAMNLIDIWSVHAFILNEHPFNWGAGIPVGFYTYTQDDVNAGRISTACFTGDVYTNDTAGQVSISDFSDTHSISIFIDRIIEFRTWLNQIGEQDKPLWITEYGSLFPPVDPPGGPDYVNVSDIDTTNFMLDSFDFLLNARDESIGLAEDDYHLVQRWFWYSLNDYRYVFGGSLLDPAENLEMTYVGEAFKEFTDYLSRVSTYLPLVIK